jgi:hypothetical protein
VLAAVSTTNPTTVETGAAFATSCLHDRAPYSCFERALQLKRPRIDTLPVGAGGVICRVGAFGQLNNQIFELRYMLFLAVHLNRTVVVWPHLAHLYDVNFLQLTSPASTRSTVALVSTDESLCDERNSTNNNNNNNNNNTADSVTLYQFPPDAANSQNQKQKQAPRQRWILPGDVKSISSRVLKFDARDIFRVNKLGVEPSKRHKLYPWLYPKRDTRELANQFVERTFGTRPFVAVHLRFLDGLCYKIMDIPACDADPALLKRLLERHAPHLLDAPVFVASDGQRPDLEVRAQVFDLLIYLFV